QVHDLACGQTVADQLLRVETLVGGTVEQERAVAVTRADRPAEAHAHSLLGERRGQPAAERADGVGGGRRGEARELVASDAGELVAVRNLAREQVGPPA